MARCPAGGLWLTTGVIVVVEGDRLFVLAPGVGGGGGIVGLGWLEMCVHGRGGEEK